MSLGRSSGFCFLGPAKVKYEKVLSSFISALSITIHHGSKMCCQDLGTDVGRTLMNMEMLKFLRARASKIIPCVVFNKVIHIIHPSLSMPFFRAPSNDPLCFALGWYKEFQ